MAESSAMPRVEVGKLLAGTESVSTTCACFSGIVAALSISSFRMEAHPAKRERRSAANAMLSLVFISSVF
ncbi:hypothetical protein ACIXK2_19985 [Bacteroides fragilis]